jgi:hypothetical protein
MDDFCEIDFVAFIIERGDEQLYRVDIKRDVDYKFFYQTKKYIIAPDACYEKCDSVLFFPHYKDRGWGLRIIQRKGCRHFIMEGGVPHLIKNKNKTGDMELIKEWIYNGTQIIPSNNVVGTKNLIYFTFFGGNEYDKLLRILLSTLKRQSYNNFDLLFITDEDTLPNIKKIRDLKKYNVDYHILPKITDPVLASMQKLKIYDYKNIDQYSKILFLDLDIIVIGNLSKIFEENIRPNVFYAGVERVLQSFHHMGYHRLLEYSSNELTRFERNNIFPFNAGQFLFKNTTSMRKHLENINNFVSKWDGEYFFEQSFLNCYFNVLGMSNVFKFKEQFCFVSINENETNNVFNPDAVFVHYMGSTADGRDKLFFMKTHYPHLL